MTTNYCTTTHPAARCTRIDSHEWNSDKVFLDENCLLFEISDDYDDELLTVY